MCQCRRKKMYVSVLLALTTLSSVCAAQGVGNGYGNNNVGNLLGNGYGNGNEGSGLNNGVGNSGSYNGQNNGVGNSAGTTNVSPSGPVASLLPQSPTVSAASPVPEAATTATSPFLVPSAAAGAPTYAASTTSSPPCTIKSAFSPWQDNPQSPYRSAVNLFIVSNVSVKAPFNVTIITSGLLSIDATWNWQSAGPAVNGTVTGAVVNSWAEVGPSSPVLTIGYILQATQPTQFSPSSVIINDLRCGVMLG